MASSSPKPLVYVSSHEERPSTDNFVFDWKTSLKVTIGLARAFESFADDSAMKSPTVIFLNSFSAYCLRKVW